MIKFIFTIVLGIASLSLKAQSQDTTIYTTVDKQPSFDGGVKKFNRFLAHNVRYPAEAREHNQQGKVIVQFVVEKDGSLSNIKVTQHVAASLDEESLRILRISPNWLPGEIGGRPVRTIWSIPLTYTLSR